MTHGKRVYTRAGDGGMTCLAGGRKVPKTHPRVVVYGGVDELNATIGLAVVSLQAIEGAVARRMEGFLRETQQRLFELGTELACPPEDMSEAMPRIRSEALDALEMEINALDADLPPLRSFVLPGGGAAGAALHLSRTVCRRVELSVVSLRDASSVREEALRYINRLSDYLFVAARAAAQAAKVAESSWEPRAAGDGSSGGGESRGSEND